MPIVGDEVVLNDCSLAKIVGIDKIIDTNEYVYKLDNGKVVKRDKFVYPKPLRLFKFSVGDTFRLKGGYGILSLDLIDRSEDTFLPYRFNDGFWRNKKEIEDEFICIFTSNIDQDEVQINNKYEVDGEIFDDLNLAKNHLLKIKLFKALGGISDDYMDTVKMADIIEILIKDRHKFVNIMKD